MPCRDPWRLRRCLSSGDLGMRLVTVIALLLSLTTAAAPRVRAQSASPPVDGPVALVGGALIDGVSGRVLRDAVVLVRDGRIERVGTVGELPVPTGYRRIDTDGHTVMP